MQRDVVYEKYILRFRWPDVTMKLTERLRFQIEKMK